MRDILRTLGLALLLTSLVAQSGCGGGGGSSTPPRGDFTIVISPTAAAVTVGGTRQFTAEARDNNGFVITGLAFSWHSSNTAIAIGAGGGSFRGVAAGTVNITASASRVIQAGHGFESVTSNPATLSVELAVEGTAATGAPLSGASVSLRDAHGQYAAASADAAGHFHIPVDGLTAPFLLKAQTPDGRVLYGMAPDLGTANVDPYTDFLVRDWYTLHGASVDAAFASENLMPMAQDMQSLDRMLTKMLQPALTAKGLDAGHFSVLSTAFAADHTGFDAVLDESQVDAAAGRIQVAGATALFHLDRGTGTLSWQAVQADGSTTLGSLRLP
jgi:hypothetical protein